MLSVFFIGQRLLEQRLRFTAAELHDAWLSVQSTVGQRAFDSD
ncbi:MAG: hypothetical protein AB7Q81_12630 [Gammaproteobacteria bacterium]